MAEAGVPDVEISAWGGIQAPAGTKPEIIGTLNAEIRKALATSDVQNHFLQFGAEAVATTPEEFGAFIRAEVDRYAPVVKRAGIKID
jgi:tripartite-type tricarboxylate transporter receptor subunit TctC